MNNDPLHDLLTRADCAAPVPAMNPGLVGNIRRSARRRAIRRNALLAVGAIVVSGVGIARWMPHPARPRNPQVAIDRYAAIRLEIIDLENKARRERQHADELQKSATTRIIEFSAAYPPPIDPLDRVNAARDRAALILLRQADRAQSPAEADEIRSSIVRLFPETPAGHVAQQRLKPAGSPI